MEWKIFWHNWLQKLITQFISVKVWILTATFVFVSAGFITPGVFSAVILGVIGIKGAFTIADIIKNKSVLERNIIDKV